MELQASGGTVWVQNISMGAVLQLSTIWYFVHKGLAVVNKTSIERGHNNEMQVGSRKYIDVSEWQMLYGVMAETGWLHQKRSNQKFPANFENQTGRVEMMICLRLELGA